MEEKVEDIKQEKKGFLEKLKKLPGRVKLLIGVLIFFVVLLGVFGFLATRELERQGEQTQEEELDMTTPEASVYFEPATVNARPGQRSEVDVVIDTWGREVSGAVLSIKYNPNILRDVRLEQFKDTTSAVSYAFSEGTVAENNEATGVIILPLSMLETTPMQKGKGVVATLSFVPKDDFSTFTQVSFDIGTTFINREGGKTIILQKGNLNINLPVDGVFPTEAPK